MGEMNIRFSESSKTFHLYNDWISYILKVLEDGRLGQLYFGKRIHVKDDYDYLYEKTHRSMSAYTGDEDQMVSPGDARQEYGTYGSGDFKQPAAEIYQENGAYLTNAVYVSHTVQAGKPKLPGLPATYTEEDGEGMTLSVKLLDSVSGAGICLRYTIFRDRASIARSAVISNEGSGRLRLTAAMSLCLDLPDSDYEMLQFSGAWSRERHLHTRHLEPGIQSVGSRRGHSSHEQNPFLILKRPHADEFQGEAMGFSLIYSGNFLAQAEVDGHDMTRVLLGIHPDNFCWILEPEDAFQTPEAVMAYTDRGLNALSQEFHRLYRTRLARGAWRDQPSPILLNNWEATYFDISEEKLLRIAGKARDCGVELFVLDDGWFGGRRSDRAGLGDWTPCRDILPEGLTGLAEKIEAMGLKFGVWIEPEMVNEDSDLYRAHPDWILKTPGYPASKSRHQWVLDFSRREVVDAVYAMIARLLREAKISYIKWDMNRSITECFSAALPPERQGEVFHRYILGVYDLYERLTSQFPHVLFESCASGGARFDPGLLYYAPQGWTSDDTDAAERLKIQYGTSFCYPVRSMGAHVSAVPNHQLGRVTPLKTRGAVACFGTFGYELDLNRLTEEEIEEVKRQIAFVKQYRRLLQYGTFYRLKSPFEGNITAWMAVSEDRREAVVGWYRMLSVVNGPFTRLPLAGLDPDLCYRISGGQKAGAQDSCYGDELMQIGLITSDRSHEVPPAGDFEARLFVLKA